MHLIGLTVKGVILSQTIAAEIIGTVIVGLEMVGLEITKRYDRETYAAGRQTAPPALTPASTEAPIQGIDKNAIVDWFLDTIRASTQPIQPYGIVLSDEEAQIPFDQIVTRLERKRYVEELRHIAQILTDLGIRFNDAEEGLNLMRPPFGEIIRIKWQLHQYNRALDPKRPPILKEISFILVKNKRLIDNLAQIKNDQTFILDFLNVYFFPGTQLNFSPAPARAPASAPVS